MINNKVVDVYHMLLIKITQGALCSSVKGNKFLLHKKMFYNITKMVD